MPFIQRVQLLQVGERRRRPLQVIGHQRGHRLHGQGRNVVVRGDAGAPGGALHRRAGYSPAVRFHPDDPGSGVELHAQLLEVRRPGVDPDVIGRTRQQSIEYAVRADQAIQQLQLSAADRPGTALLGPHRHHGAREALPQVCLVGPRHPRRRDELPPGDVLVFRKPPLGAACGHDQQAADEEAHFVQGNAKRREKLQKERPEVLQCGRETGEPGDLGLPGPRQEHARRHGEIVERVAMGAVGCPAHGVGDVLVETGEEPEPVLARKRVAAVPARIRHGNAASLAAQHRLAFVHVHGEPAFRQLMRRAETGNPSAQNGHCPLHSAILRPAEPDRPALCISPHKWRAAARGPTPPVG